MSAAGVMVAAPVSGTLVFARPAIGGLPLPGARASPDGVAMLEGSGFSAFGAVLAEAAGAAAALVCAGFGSHAGNPRPFPACMLHAPTPTAAMPSIPISAGRGRRGPPGAGAGPAPDAAAAA